MLPKVSVIIPVWNAEPYLRRCLDSVCEQPLRDIEVICVDDCSTDNSLDILRKYEAVDARVKIIDLPANSGEAVARNAALAQAKGEYVGFVDSDDFVDTNFFEKLYASAEGADICKGNMRVTIYTRKVVLHNALNVKIRQNKFYFFIHFWSAIYSNKLLHGYKIIFVPGLPIGTDICFLIQAVALSSKIITVDDVFYNYVRREDSVDSRVKNLSKIQSVISARIFIVEYINKTYVDREGYLVVFTHNYNVLVNLPSSVEPRVRAAACRLVARTLLSLYEKCRYKEEFHTAEPRYSNKFLLAGDVDGLAAYLQKQRAEKTADDLRLRLKYGFTS